MVKDSVPEVIKNDTFFSTLCHYTYVLIGQHLLKNKKFNNFFESNIYIKKYEDVLQQANLRIYPEEFFITAFLFLILLFILYFFGIVILLSYFPELFSFALFVIGIVVITIGGIGFYNYPLYYSKQRATEIEAAIPHIMPYMKLLSSDLSMANVIKLLDEFTTYKELKKEFEKIRYYNEFMGVDLNTAVHRSMKTCPSKKLAELMTDIVVISNSGGNVYSYMTNKVDRLNQEIESLEKQTLESTMILSQIYIVFLLIGPLLAAVVLSVFSFISFGTIGGTGDVGPSPGDTNSQIITFIVMLTIIPPAYFAFYLMVYLVKPLYTRIQSEE